MMLILKMLYYFIVHSDHEHSFKPCDRKNRTTLINIFAMHVLFRVKYFNAMATSKWRILTTRQVETEAASPIYQSKSNPIQKINSQLSLCYSINYLFDANIPGKSAIIICRTHIWNSGPWYTAVMVYLKNKTMKRPLITVRLSDITCIVKMTSMG